MMNVRDKARGCKGKRENNRENTFRNQGDAKDADFRYKPLSTPHFVSSAGRDAPLAPLTRKETNPPTSYLFSPGKKQAECGV